MTKKKSDNSIAQNRKARHDYFIEETIEAGIVLSGTEIKSLRLNGASIKEAYAGPKKGELFLINAHIPEYVHANKFNHEPKQDRKLLVHKKQLNKLFGLIKRERMTLVPLSLYFNSRGIAKLEIGLAKGKRKVDKRESEKEKSWKLDKARLLREKG